MKKTKTWIKVLVIITFLAMVIVNALANTLPINGQNTGQISDSYQNLFTPIGITFAIWGIIYFLLACYTIYQVFQKNEDEGRVKILNKIGIYFSISSMANLIWIFAWHYNIIWLSLILTLIMLYTIISINNLLKKEKLSIKEKIFLKLPFSIYFGWLTVATIANVTVMLLAIGVAGIGQIQAIITAVIIIIGFIIASLVILKNKDFFYGLVIIWAYTGILLKHILESGFNKQYTLIIYTVIVALLLIFCEEIYILIPKKDKNLK